MKKLITLKFMIILLSLSVYAQTAIQDTLRKKPEIIAFERSGNIFVTFSDGKERQLTFTQKDQNPNLMKSGNQVVFIRDENIEKDGVKYTRKKIMKVDINTFFEETIADQKPYKDGRDNTYEILRIENPSLSADENALYFLTPHTATTSQLIKLDIQTGKWQELFSAESYELLNSEAFKNYFLIGRSEIGSRGRGIYYFLVDESGKKLKEFDSKESMLQFKKSLE